MCRSISANVGLNEFEPNLPSKHIQLNIFFNANPIKLNLYIQTKSKYFTKMIWINKPIPKVIF